ncbi:MAG: high-potential iron-sulfur protein [Candidatus Eremiobacteraeota bacterium]|nr:high-potential iron-sulfur protein [Candidatus Eremiobacteraeota bacterium]
MQPSRKEVLQQLIVLPALASLAMLGATSIAEAKGSKAQFKYQSKPHGNQRCSGCSLFLPSKLKITSGACKVVAGPISPLGWCTAYSPKR